MSKMVFSMINFLKEDVRLVKYENQIYKLKILFEEEQKLANFVVKFSQTEAHYELEQVIRAVLCTIEKKQILNKIQTDKFVVNVKTKTWGTSQKLGFKQNGVHLPSYPFMIILNVTVKDLEEDDISNDDEICVLNQTAKLNSNKNVKNTSNDVNSNIQKKLPSKESNAKTKKASHHQQPKKKLLTTNVVTDNNTEDGLSTQDICDLLEEAQQLTEVEKMEALQQERIERRTKEDLEQFAAKYAQKVVKEKEKKKICNFPGNLVSSPKKVNQNTTRNNQRKMSDSPSISKPSSKNNESPRHSRKDQKPVTSPDKITQQSDFESSTDQMSELSKLRNRKRKLSESSQSQSPQSESFPGKRRSGRHSNPPSTSTLKLKKQKKAVEKKCLETQDSKKRSSIMSRKTEESSEESENEHLQLQSSKQIPVRKSPRIQKKICEESLPNKNNSARNSGVNLHKFRSTRRDRHLIEQDELAEDMKLQKLAKSSPKLKHKTSSRLKRRSSTLWDYIVSPVKGIFTK